MVCAEGGNSRFWVVHITGKGCSKKMGGNGKLFLD